jgi:hypothetical protein
MVLDEDELRQHLAAAADQVSAPRFTPEDLISRIRRRRARVLGLGSAPLLAVAAIAVAVPVALSGPSAPVTKHPLGKIPPPLAFTVAVNGQSRMSPEDGSPPGFTVTPGEGLRIDVEATVPADLRVTALWLGISEGTLRTQPENLHPILAHISTPLGPGPHVFRVRWTVPSGLRPGALRYVAAGWGSEQGHMARFIARLTVQSS